VLHIEGKDPEAAAKTDTDPPPVDLALLGTAAPDPVITGDPDLGTGGLGLGTEITGDHPGHRDADLERGENWERVR
jgi:hypothetical protein